MSLSLDLIVPFITIFGSAFSTNPEVMRKAGSVVRSRPPPIVFSTVWTLIVIILTVDLMKNNERRYIIYLVCGLCAMWNYLYFNQNMKKEAIAILVIILMLSLMLNNSANITGKTLIEKNMYTVLITWILVALMLNMTEVNMSN